MHLPFPDERTDSCRVFHRLEAHLTPKPGLLPARVQVESLGVGRIRPRLLRRRQTLRPPPSLPDQDRRFNKIPQ